MLKVASVIAVVGLLFVGGRVSPLGRFDGLRPGPVAARDLTSHFPNVRLRTGDNREVRFYDDLVKGKTVLINFMFTTCTALCPRGSQRLAQVQHLLGDRVGRDIFLISISVDPDHDTPAVLKRYGKRFGAGSGWVLATGTAADVMSIRQNLGDYDREDPSPHTGMIIYGNDATGSWARMPITSPATTIVSSVLRLVTPVVNAANRPR